METTWYHGSPYEIDSLRPGSTITQDEELAQAFSHKPRILSIEDDAGVLATGEPRIRHNGTEEGLLYIIDEPLEPDDIYPHPQTTMAPGLEWLTRRPLKLRLIGPVAWKPGEFLSKADIQELTRRRTS